MGTVNWGKYNNRLIEDVTRGKYNTIINLRKANRFTKFTLAVFLILLLIIFRAALFSGRAQVAIFYPSVCLGDWTNVDLASGLSQTTEGDDFSYSNSAVYLGGKNDIYCGALVGSIPASVNLRKVKLKLHWQLRQTGMDLSVPDFSPLSEVDVDESLDKKGDQIDDLKRGVETKKAEDIIIDEETGNHFSLPPNNNNKIEDSYSHSLLNEDEQQIDLEEKSDSSGDVNVDGGDVDNVNVGGGDVIDDDNVSNNTIDNEVEIIDHNRTDHVIDLDSQGAINSSQTEDDNFISRLKFWLLPVSGAQQVEEQTTDELEEQTTDELEAAPAFIDSLDTGGEEDNNYLNNYLSEEETRVASESIPSQSFESDIISSVFVDFGQDDNKPFQALAIIKYSTDGLSWQKLAELTPENWKSEFDLPLVSVDELANLQISIEGQAEPNSIQLLLDAIELKVIFDDLIQQSQIGDKGSWSTVDLEKAINQGDPLVGEKVKVVVADREVRIERKDMMGKGGFIQQIDNNFSPQVETNKIVYSQLSSSIDLELTPLSDGVREELVWNDKSVPLEVSYNLALAEGKLGVYVVGDIVAIVYDKESGEELFVFSPPRGIDATGQSVMLSYQLGGESNELRLQLPTDKIEKISFPLRVSYSIKPKEYDEVLVKIGQNGEETANAKDGDIVDIKPQNWPWGKMEKIDFVVVRVKSLKKSERENYLRTNRDPSGALHYAIDYTELATKRQLDVIRDYQQENPILDATHLFLSNVIQKKIIYLSA